MNKLKFFCVVKCLLMFIATSVTHADFIVTGTYHFDYDFGDGISWTTETFDISSDPSATLAFTDTYSQGSASASVAFGQYGIGVDAEWGPSWRTGPVKDSGVRQWDPDDVFTGPTRMTVYYDTVITRDFGDLSWGDDGYYFWTGWRSWISVYGVVGAGGYVQYDLDVEMYLTLTEDGNQVLHTVNQASYYNDTPGFFYYMRSPITPVTQDDWDYWINLVDPHGPHAGVFEPSMRLAGKVTYWASNDGGPSYIRHTDHPVNPVPEPGTFALLGIGLAGLGLYGYRRRNRA